MLRTLERGLLICCLLTARGCVRAGFDGPGHRSVADAAARKDVARSGDAQGDGSTSPLATFSTPRSIAELNTAGDEEDPSLTADLLEIFYNRAASNGAVADIWTARRTSSSGRWGQPAKVVTLSSSADETTPEVSPDGLTIYFASKRASSDYDIYMARRSSRSSPWGAVQRVAALNSRADEAAPVVVPPRLSTMVFSSKRSGGAGGYDLYRADRAGASSGWSAPVALSGLNTAAGETDPWLFESDRWIYFARRRANDTAFDIWIASRPDTTQRFGKPRIVSELNSARSQSDIWLSADSKTMYFGSNRSGSWDIFIATR